MFRLDVLSHCITANGGDSLKNYYSILGINEYATIDEIKLAFRTLMKIWHPDVCSRNDAHERFIEITEAYEILGDPLRRKEYDEILKASESTAREQAEESSTTLFEWTIIILLTIISVIFVFVIAFKVYTIIHSAHTLPIP